MKHNAPSVTQLGIFSESHQSFKRRVGAGEGGKEKYWVGQKVRLFFPCDGFSDALLSLNSFETILLRVYCDSCHINMH